MCIYIYNIITLYNHIWYTWIYKMCFTSDVWEKHATPKKQRTKLPYPCGWAEYSAYPSRLHKSPWAAPNAQSQQLKWRPKLVPKRRKNSPQNFWWCMGHAPANRCQHQWFITVYAFTYHKWGTPIAGWFGVPPAIRKTLFTYIYIYI